ncbi:MAG: RHS repeat-associated core domain-containing protein [Ignavibacteriales bacterium]|nr:RHS repeat-associated core domain-containing protein [Ignavibacteriales bacterium]
MPLQVQVGANDHINYNYDETGSRIGRLYGNANEYYLRDAGGRELAIFDMATQRPKQINLFAADQTRLTDVVGQVGTADVYPGTNSISLTKQYFLKDHLGSTRVVLNDAGACFSALDYYPYGENMREFTIGTTNCRYQFIPRGQGGKERDIVTDLDYSIARYYNAKLGVWLCVDPLLDKYPGLSPYNYCGNNPTNYIDPDGRLFILDDFIVGLASGIISGKSFSESVDQGTTYASNCAELWSSFGRGDFGQVLSKLTWEAPQQLLGVLVADVWNMSGNIKSLTHSEGATLVETNSKSFGAYTLGGIITGESGINLNSDLYRHEYGHYMQSQLLGPTYLLGIGLPSVSHAAYFAATNKYVGNIDDYFDFYTETWANNLSKRHIW